ncbi:hypothetical protein RYA05_00135 [Pseudomonas syringae pv. actinidiae]|nr:hypothetical protein [Pseudomonas syringae pv. actinidiae]
MNTNFTQTTDTCETDQERERQAREQELYTSEIRNSGNPEQEKQTLKDQKASRPYSVTLGQWQNVGDLYACTNWSPDTSTVGKDVAFEQSATDCKMDQSRTRVEAYVDHKTGVKTNVPKANETKTLTNQSNRRDSKGIREDWSATESIYGTWTNTPGMVQYSCSNWSPSPASKTTAGTFVQTATDCKIDQTRTRQDRETEANTKAVRNKGDVAIEKQTLTGQNATRNYTVALSAWANNGNMTSCSNWSPAPSTVTINQTFTQTATDCQQPQKRTRSESYVDHLSGAVVAVSGVTQNQAITATDTRNAVGTKETWANTTSVYSAWANSSEISGCTAWNPSPSSYNARTQFTQTGTGCSVTQTRSRQDQEKETTTGAIRNKGALANETQTLSGQSTTRTYLMDFSGWAWSGDNYNCSGWSPDPSTVTIKTVFTQSASCSRNQQRGAAGYTMVNGNWTSDPAVPYRVETLVSGQVITQSATGTKETWAATSPVYSAWANSSEIGGCSAWAPSPSNYTTRTQFTQTGTGCSVSQTRSRQDQEKETTTGAIRNKGAIATESQTVGGQTTTRSYLMDFNAWAWNGDNYNCSAWSPDPSTVTIGTAFTQSATCLRNQSRGAAGYIMVNGNWTADPAVPYRGESQVVGGQTATRGASGTKETWVASASVYSGWANTSDVYGCSGWSPSPSNYTERSQFTQTGTGCYINQSRTRQDQIRETTTGAVRNNGGAVTETQTVGGQSTARSYLMDFNAWGDASGYYSCSAWSPDASTVPSGQGFTQTANCYINQTRGAMGYTLVNGGWVADPGVPYRTETKAVYRATAQAATGTKVMAECPPLSGSNQFWLKVSQQADIPMATWNGVNIPNVSMGKNISPSASYGGYYYYNTTFTGNMRGGQSYPICRRPL